MSFAAHPRARRAPRVRTAPDRTVASSRRLLVFAGSAILTLVAIGAAHAVDGAVVEAEAAWTAGRTDDAHRLLLGWVVAEPRDVSSLAAAAEIAAEMKDVDLLERLQGAGENAARENSDPAFDVMLATAYLGLAEARLSRQETGSSLAFLFADAQTRARDAAAGPHAAAGRRLLARAQWAQGDLDGALAVLAQTGWGEPDARFLAFRGRLRYERAVSQGMDASGRPTPEGQADLAGTLEDLSAALGSAALGGAGLSALERGDALLTRAWAAHRVGRLEEARRGYLDARIARPTSDLPLKGLQSLCAGRPGDLTAALADLVGRVPSDRGACEALAEAHRAAGDFVEALAAAQRRIAIAPTEPNGWVLAGRLFAGIRQGIEAERHFAKALELDSTSTDAAAGLEALAIETFKGDTERGLALYERLLALRPSDPYVRNNLGFLLREVVSPWTTFTEKRTQVLKPEAPPRIRELLVRCVAVYEEAVSLLPESEDEGREELEAWNLAGIVNDAGLMRHYFEDVQDGPRAEGYYLRALRMTEGGFKDTYAPNLQQLYRHVLPDRELAWYRAARTAKDALMREETDASGAVVGLVPDETKRAAAARDETALRARIVRTLQQDAESDGAPWPPEDGGAPPR